MGCGCGGKADGTAARGGCGCSSCGGATRPGSKAAGSKKRGTGCGGGRGAAASPRPAATPIGAVASGSGTQRTERAPGLEGSVAPQRAAPSPFGARKAVEEPAGFEDGRPGLLLPRAGYVQQLFGDAIATVQEAALALFETIPDRRIRAVVDVLRMTPPDLRLQRLMDLAQMEPLPIQPLEATAYTTASYTVARVPNPLRIEIGQGSAAIPNATPVCIVNGFDPRWGDPPAIYREIPLRWNASRGWYEFEEGYALGNVRRDAWGQPVWDRLAYGQLKRLYEAYSVLQPFRRSYGSEWEYHWIAKSNREPVCVPS